MEKTKSGANKPLFADASHFVMGDNMLGYILATGMNFRLSQQLRDKTRA
jgi:hypothetical protein